MSYDLIIRGGKIVDGSGAPAYHADLGISGGRVAAIGKISGPADRVIDADGLVVAPGVIDNHCHYDAQAVWDPLCTYSCFHGATTVVIGNCGLALAPAHDYDQDALASLLSRVEAIPLEALDAGLTWSWETIPQYLDALDKRLGVNVAPFMGHSAIRRYVMGEAAYEREADDDELHMMKDIVRSGMEAGALGISFERNMRHFDWQGRTAPSNLASDQERFELAEVLDDVGCGAIQIGGDSRLGIRLAQAGGRPVLYGGITQNAAAPNQWQEQMEEAEQLGRDGLRAFLLFNPQPTILHYTLKTAQHFDALPTWKTVMMLPLQERMQAFRDPQTRAKLHFEAVDTPYSGDGGDFTRRWDLQFIFHPKLRKNDYLTGMSVEEAARVQGKDILDTFLDLALEEDLETVFERRERNGDPVAMTAMLNSPGLLLGQSDGGAHVVFRSDYSFPTYVLGHWVREKGVLSLEQAVRKLTFDSALVFGLNDRGLLRPGYAADIMVFDPDTVGPLEAEDAPDLPGGASRRKQLAAGMHSVIVNGQVLIDHGEHTGAYPGRVARTTPTT